MMAPFFLRHPQAFEDSMDKFVHVYLMRCEEACREPDLDLLGPIEEVLSSLSEEQS